MQSLRGEILRALRATDTLMLTHPTNDYERFVFTVKLGAILKRLDGMREEEMGRLYEKLCRSAAASGEFRKI